LLRRQGNAKTETVRRRAALALAHAKGMDLCSRQGQGSGARGYITKADVEGWAA